LPGLFPGKAAHRELTELIKAGLTNYEAYSAGTRNGGEFIRRLIDADVRLGQVQEGYRANLALLEGNPLEDIRNARKVAGVMINGRFRSAEDLQAERNRLRDRYGRLNKLGERADLALTLPMPRAALERLITESMNETDATEMIESRITAAGYGAAYAGDMERSLSILTLNAELFPESAAAWENLARLKLHLERTQEALDHYRRALALDSSLDSVAEQIRQLEDVR
jgi:tetratricopeptide (TPR) repeat protein